MNNVIMSKSKNGVSVDISHDEKFSFTSFMKMWPKIHLISVSDNVIFGKYDIEKEDITEVREALVNIKKDGGVVVAVRINDINVLNYGEFKNNSFSGENAYIYMTKKNVETFCMSDEMMAEKIAVEHIKLFIKHLNLIGQNKVFSVTITKDGKSETQTFIIDNSYKCPFIEELKEYYDDQDVLDVLNEIKNNPVNTYFELFNRLENGDFSKDVTFVKCNPNCGFLLKWKGIKINYIDLNKGLSHHWITILFENGASIEFYKSYSWIKVNIHNKEKEYNFANISDTNDISILSEHIGEENKDMLEDLFF